MSILDALCSSCSNNRCCFQEKEVDLSQVNASSLQSCLRRLPMAEQFFLCRFHPSNACDIPSSFIRSLVLPGCERSVIVIVNGIFSSKFSSLEAVPELSVTSSLQSSSFSTCCLNQKAREGNDPFSLLCHASCYEELRLVVPSVRLQAPVQILYVMNGSTPLWMMPKLHISLEKGASMHLIETYGGDISCRVFVNQYTSIELNESAQLGYHRLSCVPSKKIALFSSSQVMVHKQAVMRSVSISDLLLSRHHVDVQLLGEESSYELYLLSLLRESQEADCQLHVRHAASRSRSMLVTRGVVGNASSNISSTVLMEQGADASESCQRCAHLCLGASSRTQAQPNFKIFADDVQAVHGATMSSVDSEMVWYLQSRGLSAQEATSALVESFCAEVIRCLSLEVEKEYLRKQGVRVW